MDDKIYNDFMDYIVDFGFNPLDLDYSKSVLKRFCKEKAIMSPAKFGDMFNAWMTRKS